jgi:hypothetical protein
MKESYTAVVARNVDWTGAWATEPYETAWADEAIFFVRVLKSKGNKAVTAHVQISPDGMRWANEGSSVKVAPMKDGVSFVRVKNFGGWLRLAGTAPKGASLRVMAYLALKG